MNKWGKGISFGIAPNKKTVNSIAVYKPEKR